MEESKVVLRYETRKIIDVDELDRVVKEVYGKPYSFQQQGGCKERGNWSITVPEAWDEDYENDTVPEEVNHEDMGVSFKAWLARDPEQKLDTKDEWDRNSGLRLWWTRNFYPEIQTLMNDLHKKGVVPKGNYTIDIDW